MDWLNKWFNDYSETPAGSILMFMLVFLLRIALDRWQRKRETAKTRKRKGVAHG